MADTTVFGPYEGGVYASSYSTTGAAITTTNWCECGDHMARTSGGSCPVCDTTPVGQRPHWCRACGSANVDPAGHCRTCGRDGVLAPPLLERDGSMP